MNAYVPLHRFIPENSWVSIGEFRSRRMHKVFATNGDVLTYCNRWLKRSSVTAVLSWTDHDRCQLCDKADHVFTITRVDE